MVLAPELQLTLFACCALILEVLLAKNRKVWAAYTSLLGIAVTGVALLEQYSTFKTVLPKYAFYNMYVLDNFSLVLKSLILLGTAGTIIISTKFLDTEGEQHGDYYSLLLFAAVGMMFMISGADLLSIYISLELMSISGYILVGYLKKNDKANEASIKYFLLGAFSSGIMLYGISLIYGVTGHTNLTAIATKVIAVVNNASPIGDGRYLLLLGVFLLSVGLFFKIAAVPFHMWAPDAYEGAATPITAFMSVAVKTASYAILLRIFLVALPSLRNIEGLLGWEVILQIVAAMTMTIGNLAAATQNNVKRLLAYSSISHAGYLLLGIVAGNQYGYTGVVIYLLVYTIMNLGAFGVIVALRRKSITGDHINHFKGLVRQQPGLAIMMLIFLLSLAGIPATAGFIGKYFLFAGLIQTTDPSHARLAIIAVLNTVLSFYYYARLIKAMFMESPQSQEPLEVDRSLYVFLALAALLTLFIGLWPQPFIRFSQQATDIGAYQNLSNGQKPVLTLPSR